MHIWIVYKIKIHFNWMLNNELIDYLLSSKNTNEHIVGVKYN